MRALSKVSISGLLLGAMILSAASPVLAADSRRGGREGHMPDFHGRDFGGFAAPERNIWAGGHWTQAWHGPRYGWWWVVGDLWYFYPDPIYPYPTYVPPAIVEQAAPPVPAGLPPAQNWYFCDNPQGYYPYVASCNDPWRAVPTAPATGSNTLQSPAG